MFKTIKRWWGNAKSRSKEGERVRWVDRILCELQDIVNLATVRAELPEAAARVDYLLSRHCTVSPIMGQEELIFEHLTTVQKSQVAPLLILPYLPDDGYLCLTMKDLTLVGRIGAYCPRYHMIVMNMCGLVTLRHSAAVMLHEAGHAVYSEVEGRVGKDASDRAHLLRLEEELDMWLFDLGLARAIGGDQLESAMAKTVAQYWQPLLFGEFQGHPGIGVPLDLCYGPVIHEADLKIRDALYVLFCQLAAAAYLDPIQARQGQLNLIKFIYERKYEIENDTAG